MAKLNISQAARATGKSRSTIQRHIRRGKITSEKDGLGNPVLDVSELERVYGSVKNPDAPDAVKQGESVTQSVAPPDTHKIILLEQQVSFLEQRLAAAQEQTRKAESRETEARDEAKRLLGIIEHQTRLIEAPKEPEKQTGFFKRLFG